MARSIAATVGIHPSTNHSRDVVTVQELLNGVEYDDGGPYVKLAVDGACGPKTEKAIQTFQLKHFGWSGADGRVHPGRQTLQKLNELNSRPDVGQAFLIYTMKSSGTLKRSNPNDWYFLIELVPDFHTGSHFHSEVYWFGPSWKKRKYRPKKGQFIGKKYKLFFTDKPYKLSDLAGPAMCLNRQHIDHRTGTTLYEEGTFLKNNSGSKARFKIVLPLKMDGDEPPGPNVRIVKRPILKVDTEYYGLLQLIK